MLKKWNCLQITHSVLWLIINISYGIPLLSPKYNLGNFQFVILFMMFIGNLALLAFPLSLLIYPLILFIFILLDIYIDSTILIFTIISLPAMWCGYMQQKEHRKELVRMCHLFGMACAVVMILFFILWYLPIQLSRYIDS